jgi:hypothetical protein
MGVCEWNAAHTDTYFVGEVFYENGQLEGVYMWNSDHSETELTSTNKQ